MSDGANINVAEELTSKTWVWCGLLNFVYASDLGQ